MRLTAIKLAGFKSFVDPTTFQATDNLTGIVGPNGCGKSNIIDAVRWVMGEGSAKVLRGESMADVIFSGSSTRKPVGTATVELLFDNSEGRIADQFASYNEISVKRQVSRDGLSQYFLNGARCRRKDIRDLFLGTGLGASSYSIIEQGMISAVVDARPEEIRSHLEEAAGISRYKERRRETENRIRRTRDNLARLSDLREEVGKHLNRLKRQASAANRYRKLKQERRELEARLLALRLRDTRQGVEQGKAELTRREAGLEEKIAAQRSAESALEELHQDQAGASESFSEVQGELYSVGSEIARLEQTIAHARELQQRQQQELAETNDALQDLEKHMVLDRAQVEELTRSLAEVEPSLAEAEAAEQSASSALQAADDAVSEWQQTFEAHHQQNTDVSSQADGKRARTEVLDQRLLQATRRLKALDEESGSGGGGGLGAEIEELEKTVAGLTGREEKARAKVRDGLESLRDSEEKLRAEQTRLHELQRELHLREGRRDSLEAMREALTQSVEADWLSANGLDAAKQLARTMTVEPGWEQAVSAVLGQWQESIVANLDQVAGSAQDVQDVSMGLVDGASGSVPSLAGSLAEQVEAPDAAIRRLNRVALAGSLEEALDRRSALADGHSLMTQDGFWVGPDWLWVLRGKGSEDSIIARENELKRLGKEIEQLTEKQDKKLKEIDRLGTAISEAGESLEARRAAADELGRELSSVSARLDSRKHALNLFEERQNAIESERATLKEQIADDEKAVRVERAALDKLVGRMAELTDQRRQLESTREGLLNQRQDARAKMSSARDRRHELALKAESRRASLDSLRQSLERMDTQFSQLQQRYLTLSETAARAVKPEEEHAGEMETLLARRVETEKRLAAARAHLQDLENQYRQRDSERQAAVQQADELRQDLERARLAQQERELDSRNIRRQVEALGADADELMSGIPEEADAAEWEAELGRLSERIVRLEPVNLAAIQEFEEEQKRKEYLDSQNEDLCQALVTLENAIAKIDRKTRTRFKETFERVNKGVQELFPRLFGGGHAYLALTGEDLLTTGVSIMARPPGKRVSSIHLLSGGEKALTAVSFVFSIFQLNPAPFCLLDEVDAPLDDANVSRFATMVREMSESVQFVIVTHNKITMEMVNRLSGVTMREPGVSRLVQVDVDEAAKLAAS